MWSETAPDDWRTIQQNLNAHFLQSSEWAEFQRALKRKVLFASGEGWSWMAILEKGQLGSRLYCPYGPTANSWQAFTKALSVLTACAKIQHVAYVRVEPQTPLEEADFSDFKLVKAHRDIQPRYTFVKDLTRPENELLAEMSATNRNLYRTAGNKGLRFRSSIHPDEVAIFLGMIHEVAGRNDIVVHGDWYYKRMVEALMPLGALKLYIAEADGQPVASSLVFDSPTTRYYAHAANYAAARKLHPGTPLLAHMIFDAKAAGQTHFDFFGVSPPDEPSHRWAGFTQFKESFGGEVVDMHGTWEISVNKIFYNTYRLATKASQLRLKH
ncbi:MAG TPA: peptidoglycan bridge formation glycyltransferase FemA/FemB family protein [Candidatus Acidoferrum sp.]|nr:peptidoglycan bridge formation glycyltransferase FemA/FemB family protein [Candidatus Acidoferrum sp.]